MMAREEIISNNPIVDLLVKYGVEIKGGGREVQCCCPFHEDTNPSMSINTQKQTFFCHGCGAKGSVIDLVMKFEGVQSGEAMKILAGEEDHREVKRIVKPPSPPKKKVQLKEVMKYVYRNHLGAQVYGVIRYEPKTFRQAHKTDNGWKWGMEGVSRVPYNLPEVINAEKVYICEGEKDADTITKQGEVGTCNVGGAGKWLDAYSAYFEGKEVIICPDQDEPGEKHAQQVLKSVSQVAKWVKVLRIPNKDISEYLDNGGVLKKLEDAAGKIFKGVMVGTRSMRDELESLKMQIDAGDRGALDLGKWLKSLRKYRRLIPGEMMVVIAATGDGKTAVLQNIAWKAKPLKVLMFELELPGTLLVERQIGIDTPMVGDMVEKSIRRSEVKDIDLSNINHIFVNTSPMITIDDLARHIRESELVIGSKPDVVMLDYIQLLTGSGSRYEKTSNAAEALKRIAKETNTIMIVASQAHRPEKGKQLVIGLHSGKDSGGIENSAGMVLGLSRDEDDRKTAYVRVLKCTKGDAVAGKEIICKFEPTLRITEEEAYYGIQ